MPLIGITGNASNVAYRGNYDFRPFRIDFPDIIDAIPGQPYFTPQLIITGINYKVPISISGDGKYAISNVVGILTTFDSTLFSFDDSQLTFDLTTSVEGLTYTDQPSFVRNGQIISLRVLPNNPTEFSGTFDFEPRSGINYNFAISDPFEIFLRGILPSYSFPTSGTLVIDTRESAGYSVGSDLYGRDYTTVISIGKSTYTWNIRTLEALSANGLQLDAVENAFINSDIESSVYVVNGLTDVLDYVAEIEYTSNLPNIIFKYPEQQNVLLSVNYGPYTPSATVNNGDIVRLKASTTNTPGRAIYSSIKIATTTNVGIATTSWQVQSLLYYPTNLVFNSIIDAPLNSYDPNATTTPTVVSNQVIVDGLTDNFEYEFEYSPGTLDGIGLAEVRHVKVDNNIYFASTENPIISGAIQNGSTVELYAYTTGESLGVQTGTFTVKVPGDNINTPFTTSWTVENEPLSLVTPNLIDVRGYYSSTSDDHAYLLPDDISGTIAVTHQEGAVNSFVYQSTKVPFVDGGTTAIISPTTDVNGRKYSIATNYNYNITQVNLATSLNALGNATVASPTLTFDGIINVAPTNYNNYNTYTARFVNTVNSSFDYARSFLLTYNLGSRYSLEPNTLTRSFKLKDAPFTDSVTIYSNYDHEQNDHLLTTSSTVPSGYSRIRTIGYAYSPSISQPAGTIPLYRLVKTLPKVDHLYLTSATLLVTAFNQGYVIEESPMAWVFPF